MKRFGAVAALAGVDVDFAAGEIHAVLGENGAGKTTLMHVLAGIQRPDAGTVWLAGRPASFRSPRAARQAGIGMVHQHFSLVEGLTVGENLALGLSGSRRWHFDAAAVAVRARALAEEVGLELAAPDTLVAELPLGARQRLEILKALSAATRVLILDEPTAVLTPQEVRQLFGMLRRLRAAGRTVLFITHKLREVKEVADRVTILRRGQVVGVAPTAALDEGEMAERMVGALPPAPRRTEAPGGGEPRLEVVDLRVLDDRGGWAVDAVSLEARVGEVLGIAGVDGNGQRELFEALIGARRPASGQVRVDRQLLRAFTPRAALAAGIAHIPPDRQRQGLVLPMTVAENFLLSRALLDRLSRHGLLARAGARRFAAARAGEYTIHFAALDAPVRGLSGGNQQRVVVARALAQRPLVLIAVNPTRGLDVAAATAVADALLEVARAGCAVVLISTDLDEVLELSDRVSVLSCGRLSPPLRPPIDPEVLGRLMAGAVA